MNPTLLPSLERQGRLKLDQPVERWWSGVSAATIDRLLVEIKIAVAGGKRGDRVLFGGAANRQKE